MRNRVTDKFTTIVALCAVSPLAAQEVVKHDNEKVSVTLPQGWRMGRTVAKMAALGKERKRHRIMSFVAVPTDSSRGVNIRVDVENSGAFRIRPDVLRERVFYQSIQEVKKCVFGDKPMLHIVARWTKPSKVLAAAYRRATGRTVRITVRCSPSQWEDNKPAFFEMAKTMRIDLAPWPARPGGRTEKLSNGILFSSAPAIKKPAMREVQKCALEVQKGMTEMHGAIERPKGDPLVIYVNELMADHKEIAEEQKVTAVVREPGHHRLFTISLAGRGSDQRNEFVQAVSLGILSEVYGLTDCLWFEVGERMIAAQRDATKRKLPSVAKVFIGKIDVSMDFTELANQKKVPTADYWKECLAYVGMFHAGPKEYRAAYQAFLAELKATGDAGAANKKHLLSLDQNKMQADVRAFVKKLRGVKVK